MGEIGLGMLTHVGFHGVPFVFVIADLFAVRADAQQAAQDLNFGEGSLEFTNQLLSFLFALSAL